MSGCPELSMVFPVFDEEMNIGRLLENALEIGGRLTRDFEVVVVDDGSRDGTASILDTLCAEETRVRVVRHASNGGYGAALRSGLREARGELIFFSDADLQFDLRELEQLLSHTQRFEIVAGYRAPRRDPLARVVIARVYGALVRALFGLRVRDIDCAFKVFRREVIEGIAMESVGAFINTEILVRARAAGHRIHQIPVTHSPRPGGRQSGARPRVILKAIAELTALYGELRRTQRSSGAIGAAEMLAKAPARQLRR